MRVAWNKGKTKLDFPQLSNTGVKKGNIPWNKGKKCSLKHSGQFKVGHSFGKRFKKGHVPWNKGRKMSYKHGMLGKKHTEEAKKKISKANTGKKRNGEFRRKRSRWAKNNKDMLVVAGVNGYLSQANGKITKPEKELKKKLDRLGILHISQHPMYGKFVVDEFLPKLNTVIEVDGRYWHNLPRRKRLDKAKDAYLRKCGHKVVRLWEDEVSDFSTASL
jgi:very-short-patch-repair endonuclease